MRFDALTGGSALIPAAGGRRCSRSLPGYRLDRALNVLATLLTFLAAVSLFVGRAAVRPYLLVDDLNKVFIVLTTFVGFTTSVFSASYIGHEIEIGRLTPTFVRFYHAMYQALMFAMNLALVANNIGLMWVAIETGDADHRADGRHLPHARGAGGGLEIFHPRQRRHRAGAVRHHPGLHGGAAGDRRRASTPWCGPCWCSAPQNSIRRCSTSPSCSCCSATAPRWGWRRCTPGCPMRTPKARPRSRRCCRACCSTSRSTRCCASRCCSRSIRRRIAPGPLMVTMGLISCVFAAFMLYRRRDIKRMFAYSSIEHMGIIAFAFGMGGALANFAGLLHMTMHSLTKSAIFFAVGHIAQVKGTQKIADMGGLTVTNPVLGWGLVLGVVAIAGLPPLGIFMSEFLVVSSTFAREPWLAADPGVRHPGRRSAACSCGSTRIAFGEPARANRQGRSVLRADVRASGTRVHGRHLYAAGAGQRLPRTSRGCWDSPWPCSTASHIANGRAASAVAARGRGARTAGAWQSTSSRQAAARCSACGAMRRHVHMALLDEARAARSPSSAITLQIRTTYPECRRAAIRRQSGSNARSAIYSVLKPVGAARSRGPGSISASGTCGIRSASAARVASRAPYEFLPAEGEGLHQIPVGPVHAGIIEPGHFRFTANGETRGAAGAAPRLRAQGHRVADGGRRRLRRRRGLPARTSGDSTVAYAFAFAQAAEAAMQVKVPSRATYLRALMAELERLANHFGDIGAICNDASFSHHACAMRNPARAHIARSRSLLRPPADDGS